LLLALALFVAGAGAPKGWKWDKSIARADDGVPTQCGPATTACGPNGWSWNDLPDGWSWNEAEIVSTGDNVTLAGDDSSVAVAAPDGSAPEVGDTVVVVDTGDDTLLGFPKETGGIAWTELGWSWND